MGRARKNPGSSVNRDSVKRHASRQGSQAVTRDDQRSNPSVDNKNTLTSYHRILLDALPDAVFIHDYDTGAVIDVNRRVTELFGFSRDEVLKIDPNEASAGYPPHSASEAFEWIRKARDEGPQIFEWMGRRKDGALFPTEVSLSTGKVDDELRVIAVVRDITDRKNAERLLHISEEKYRTLFHNYIDAVFVHPLKGSGFGRFIEVNDVACHRLGYTREELLSMTAADITVPADTKKQGAAEMRRRLSRNGNMVFEVVHYAKDGTRIPVEVSSSVFDYEGRPAIISVARDLREVKQAQRALRRSEELYRSAIDDLTLMVCRYRPDDVIEFVNDTYCRYFEKSRADLVGTTFFGLTFPEDRDAVRAKVSALSADTPLFVHEHQVIDKDGHIRWHRWTNRAILDDAGHVVTVQAFGEDVTERKQTALEIKKREEFLQNVFDAIQDGLSVLSPDLDIVRVNHWMEEMYRHRAPIIGKKCYDVYQQRTAPCPFCPSLRTFKTGETYTEIVPYPAETEPRGWIELTSFPIKDADGTVRNVIEYVKDITEQRTLEQQLRQTEKMQAIGQLAGGIAHDFNNQLVGIVGYADILREELAADDYLAGMAENVLTATKRATDLTSQLLAFARKGKYRAVPVDIHVLITEVASLLSRSIDKRITIKKMMNAVMPVTHGDPSQLQNALLNLALNARDAMPDGGDLILATENVYLDEEYCKKKLNEIRKGDYIRISVTDTGIGMDGETVTRIFEPFFTTKVSGQGIGMGLAAVYGTVKNHNGAINVYSEPGHGTTVSLYLPVYNGAGENAEAVTDRPHEFIYGTGRILLVDDEEIVCKTTAEMLRRLGYAVSVCRNGAEAVECYRRVWRDIDAVILDMVMPVMGGREAFAEMKKINPDVIVLLSTGYSLNGAAQSIMSMGVADFIQKPFNVAELSHKLASLLQYK